MAEKTDDDAAGGAEEETPSPTAEGTAEDAAEGTDSAAAGGPDPRRRMKLIAAIAVGAVSFIVLVGVLTITGAFHGLWEWLSGAPQRATIDLPDPAVYHEFPEMLVDLKTGRCRSPFIKLKVVAEVSGSHVARLEKVELQVLDGFQAFLRTQERADLVGEDGTAKLRREFLRIINEAMAPDKAYNVLFREILLQ